MRYLHYFNWLAIFLICVALPKGAFSSHLCVSSLEVSAGKYLSVDGTLVELGNALLSPYSSTALYGTGVFDTGRVYQHVSGRRSAFRLGDHIDRLIAACDLAGIPLADPKANIEQQVLATLKANGFSESFLRISVLLDQGPMGLLIPPTAPKHTVILNWEWGQYLGQEGTSQGIQAHISRFRRQSGREANAKLIGNYSLATLARNEAARLGFQEAILLDEKDHVAEATGENIFVVKDGKIITSPTGAILMGITRSTVLWLAKEEHGFPVQEELFEIDRLFSADEVFLTGTAAEIVPVIQVNETKIGDGKPGPVTRALQSSYRRLVRGGVEKAPAHWFSFVD